MKIIELKKRGDLQNTPKLNEAFGQFEKLIKELDNRNLPGKTVEFVNRNIEELNSSLFSEKNLKRLCKKKQTQITKLLEKEHKLVPKNYYRNVWLPLGMTAFGIPIGVAFGASIGNMGLLAIGLPIGSAIGLAVGIGMDKKALTEGRQLNTELKSIL